MLGLSCGTWKLGYSAAWVIFSCGTWTFSWEMWDLVPWPGVEPRSPVLGVWSLSHWATREVPGQIIFDKSVNVFQWERKILQQMMLGKLDTPTQEWSRTLILYHIQILTQNEEKNLSIRPKTIKQKTQREKLHDIEFGTKSTGNKSKNRLFSRLVLSNSSATPWTVARQALLSMEFSRQEYWSGLPFPSPGDLPNPRNEPTSLHCRRMLYHWASKSKFKTFLHQRTQLTE